MLSNHICLIRSGFYLLYSSKALQNRNSVNICEICEVVDYAINQHLFNIIFESLGQLYCSKYRNLHKCTYVSILGEIHSRIMPWPHLQQQVYLGFKIYCLIWPMGEKKKKLKCAKKPDCLALAGKDMHTHRKRLENSSSGTE